MNKYISYKSKCMLFDFIDKTNFEDRRTFNNIENKYYGKILCTRNKKLIAYTSLPFISKRTSIDYLRLLWYNECRKCKTTNQRKNVPYGCLQPEVFVIGIAPGHGGTKGPYKQNKYKTRTMSFGLVADYMKNALIELDMHHKTWYTNIIKCSLLTNRKPSDIEVENCAYWLKQELKILKPKIIILLGNDAYNYFNQYFSFYSADIYKVHHPAYFMRCGKSLHAYFKYIKRELNVL